MFKKISFFLVMILFLNITLGAFSKFAFATEVNGESVLDITDEENINGEDIQEGNKKQQEVIDEEISKDNNVDALQEEAYKEEIEENSEEVKIEENLEEINPEKELSIAKEDRYEIKIEKGKNYEIKNVGQEEVNLNAFSYYDHNFDYAKYNQDGSVSNFDKDKNGDIWLRANQRIIVTNHENENMGFYVPYEKKNNIEIKEVKNPAIIIYNIEKDKSLEINNVGSDEIVIGGGGLADRYEYVKYNKEGTVNNFHDNSYGNIKLKLNQRLILRNAKNDNLEFYIPYEKRNDIEVKFSEEKVISSFTLEVGKSYKIVNETENEAIIKNATSYVNRFDYIRYKTDSSYISYVDQFGDINIKSGEYILLSPSSKNSESIKMYFPFVYQETGLGVKEIDYGINDIFGDVLKVEVNILKKLSKEKTETNAIEIQDNLSNYYISIINETTNKNIHGISIKDNYIILPFAAAKIGDNLKISLESKSRDSSKCEVNVKIGESTVSKVDAVINQLGYINIDYNKETNNKNTVRALVFNSDGNNIQTLSTSKEETLNSKYLNNGKYTVVLLRANGELWRLDKLEEVDDRGLVENTDYIKYQLEIKEGIIEKINAGKVPVLDENRISFFNRNNTIVTTTTESVAKDGLIGLRVEYEFKNLYSKDNIKNASISIKIPDEINLIDNSVILDNKSTGYTFKNDVLNIPITNMKGVIKVSLKPLEAKTIELKVEAKFNYSNRHITETLGIANLEVQYLTLNGVSDTSSKSITLNGIAPAGKTVNIYDGEVKIGTIKALSSGKWSTKVTLNNAYNGSYHNIVAKLFPNTENEVVSNALTVRYYVKNPSIKEVIMIHNDKKTDLTNVFLEGKKPVVTFVPGKSFTFNLSIDNSEVIEELYITSKRNNEEKKLKAIYDEKKGIWIASGYFDSNNNSYVPGTLNISYKTKYEKIDFSGEVDFKQFIEDLPPQLQNPNINVTENKNDSIKAEITLNDKNNTKVEITESVSKVPAGTTISSLLNQGYIHVEDSKYIKYEYTAGSSYLKFTVADMATGMLDYFSAELIDKTPLSGIAGVYGTATDVIQLFGRAFKMDVAKINIQSNPNLSAQQKKDMLNRVDQLAALTVVYDVYKVSIGLLTTAGLINPAMGVLIAAVCVIGDKFMEEIFENDPLFNMFMKDGVIINWLIDPSGYVYEAIEENRLKGVTATVYYKDEETGEAVIWNAEDYDQVNPQITDENGQYAWDVPEGLWQVKYELEGYETAYSEWLPVPPPQTTVNIEMISKAVPEVTMMNLFDNYVELTFNKYMQVNSVTDSEITIKDDKNNSIPVTVTAADEKTMTNGTKVAKKFIVNLNSNLVKNNSYTVEIKNTVKTYADVSAKENIKITSKYKPLPTKLLVEDSYIWNYGDEMEITVSAEVVEGIENLNLIVNSSITDIISVESNKVKFDKNGKAKIKLIGNLPGEAILSLNIEGTDITKEVTINLLLENKDEVEDNKNPDVNGDGVIDILDISLIAAKYNKKSTGDDWNEKLDINNDNIIDMFDLVLVSKKVK